MESLDLILRDPTKCNRRVLQLRDTNVKVKLPGNLPEDCIAISL